MASRVLLEPVRKPLRLLPRGSLVHLEDGEMKEIFRELAGVFNIFHHVLPAVPSDVQAKNDICAVWQILQVLRPSYRMVPSLRHRTARDPLQAAGESQMPSLQPWETPRQERHRMTRHTFRESG